MMQKAEPGELMFGEQTNDLLPDTLKAASKAYRNKESVFSTRFLETFRAFSRRFGCC